MFRGDEEINDLMDLVGGDDQADPEVIAKKIEEIERVNKEKQQKKEERRKQRQNPFA